MNDPYDLAEHTPRLAKRNGQSMLCPKCKASLLVGFDHDVEVDFCEQCKGMWADYIEEKQLLNIKPEVFSIDELRRLRKLYKPLEHKGETGYVLCPVCRQLMQKKNWGSYSGVIVDHCGQHGVWYDKGELEKIKEYIALGGVEYEKFRLMEEGFNDQDRNLMREVCKLDQRIESAYGRARFYNLIGF